MKIIYDAFTHPDSAIRWINICVVFMFDGFRWLSLYSTRERKNNSESAQAEFDLCSHHQSISMAGLNLLSPKLKQTVSRYYPKAADVLHCAPYLKPEAAGPQSCPNDQGQKEGLGENEPSGGSHKVTSVMLLWELPQESSCAHACRAGVGIAGVFGREEIILSDKCASEDPKDEQNLPNVPSLCGFVKNQLLQVKIDCSDNFLILNTLNEMK